MKYNSAIPASYIIFQRDEKNLCSAASRGWRQVLMLRRFNTGYKDGQYSLVAGHVEKDELPLQCAIRESYEESGVRIKEQGIKPAHVMYRKVGTEGVSRVDFFFLVTDWEGEIRNMEPHKCDDLSWFSLDSLPDNTIDFIRLAFTHIAAGQFYSEYGF